MQTPAESPPAPGVTRASLRPKPAAKASPEDEQSEGAKPAVGLRHARAPSGGPDVSGPVPESPGSPQHSKGSVPEGETQCIINALQPILSAVQWRCCSCIMLVKSPTGPISVGSLPCMVIFMCTFANKSLW